MSLLRTKAIEQSIDDTTDPEHRLRKDLGPLDLIVFGVGVMVGAGIFVLTGQQAGRTCLAASGRQLPRSSRSWLCWPAST